MYRVLAEVGETKERRNYRAPQPHAMPSKGVFLMAYVIIDLFSRFVVGWMLADKECKHLAAQLFADTIAPRRRARAAGPFGPRLRDEERHARPVARHAGRARSFSLPRVSNDNPFSEAGFKTMKYPADYPGRFAGELHGRAWLGDFFAWSNDDHHHAGLALFTPADVFYGRVGEVAAIRQAALDAAYAAHPERFPQRATLCSLAARGGPHQPHVHESRRGHHRPDRHPAAARNRFIDFLHHLSRTR
jgi:putative transposase